MSEGDIIGYAMVLRKQIGFLSGGERGNFWLWRKKSKAKKAKSVLRNTRSSGTKGYGQDYMYAQFCPRKTVRAKKHVK